MLAKHKTLRVAWKQIEDVIASHLYAIRAVSPSDEIVEILITKRYEKTMENMDEYAELSIRYIRKDKDD